MIRRIIIPKERTYTLEIPESFLGKKVEVIAFQLEEYQTEKLTDNSCGSLEDLFKKFEDLNFDSQGSYSFDRNEATDYE